MKPFILLACVVSVAFAAPHYRSGGNEVEKAGGAMIVALNAICTGFNELKDAYEELGQEKRSWDAVIEGLGGVCKDLQETKMGELDANKDGELSQEELNGASSVLMSSLASLCEALKELAKMSTSEKRSWESVFENLGGVCVTLGNTIQAEMEKGNKRKVTGEDGTKLPPSDKPSKEDVEELIELCMGLKEDDDKRDDEPELEEVCKELAKMLEKGSRPKPTEMSERGKKGPRPPKTDEDGNTLPPPEKPTKEEIEELIALCEALKDEKREDEPELEEVCRELAKMLEKGPKPTESSKRGKKGPRPPKTDEDGNTLPPPEKPTKEEIEELIELCEALKDEKREDEPELEEVCRELAKMLEKGPKPTESSKRGKGPRPPKTDEDGNTLPPPEKPTKEEIEELIALCEALKDEKREDEPELEEVCRELAKMLEKGPKPTETSKRGKKGPRPPKTDEDGNTLPPPEKPTKEEIEELIALCEALKDEKREDEPELEEVCRELAKMLEKGPKPTETSKRGKKGPKPPKTDEDGNTIPPPEKPTKEEIEELIALCEALKDEKREDKPELEEACRELAKMLEKGPKPTETSKRGKKGPRPPKTDEDGNTLPPPEKPTKEEIEELIALCEALKDEKREDEPELEEVCRELAKMLEKGPKPTETSKRGKKGPKPPKTDENGNTLPPPEKPTKEEIEELIALCEALKDEKREDEPELEEVCRELAKMLEKGPKPTETSKRGKKGPRPPKTDEDGNTLPPPEKPTKEEIEELIELCEALKDEKREDEPELEEVCRELAKMLEKGPKPTESSKRGKGPRPPKTDEDGNTLPPPDKLTKEEFEELIEMCKDLKGEKRADEPDMEEVCRELGKMLEKGPKPTEESKRGRKGPRPPKTDEDGNTLPPPEKPTKEEIEALIAECEALKDGDKRQDDPTLEEICRKLAKMGDKKKPRTDDDGNILPPPTKPAKRFFFF